MSVYRNSAVVFPWIRKRKHSVSRCLISTIRVRNTGKRLFSRNAGNDFPISPHRSKGGRGQHGPAHFAEAKNTMSTTLAAKTAAKTAAIAALNAVCAEYDAYRAACAAVDASPLAFTAKVWPTFGPLSARLTLAIWARKHLMTPEDCSGLTPTDRRFRRIERKFRHAPDSVARSGAYRSFAEAE